MKGMSSVPWTNETKLAAIPVVGVWQVVTYLNGNELVLQDAGPFDTQAEAEAFIAGAYWGRS